MVGGEADGAAGAGRAAKPSGPGRPPLVRHAATPVTGTPPPLDRYSMRLVTRRHLYDQGAQLGACPSLAPLARPERLHANPAEVEALGVVAGDRVRVRSPRATLVVEIEPDAAVPKGVVVLGFNIDGAEGGRASHLIDSSLPAVDVRVETT
jgi:anaerobic selenocysteine-containing dehydrogenase